MATASNFGLGNVDASESTTNTSNTDNSQASGFSQQAGGDLLQLAPTFNLAGGGSLSNLTLSDYGAIDAATDLLQGGLTDIVGLASRESSNAADAVKRALGLAQRTSASDVQSIGDIIVSALKWILLAVAAAYASKAVISYFSHKKG